MKIDKKIVTKKNTCHKNGACNRIQKKNGQGSPKDWRKTFNEKGGM